jgi:uncharacterized protein (TIGR03000 family)
MAIRTLTKWLLGVALAMGMTSLQANSAQAHIFGHGGSCGSSGGWGSYGSSGGWGWRHGSSGGWGSCGSSGGSWGSYGSYGSSGGSWGSYGSSGGSWGSYGCCGSSGGGYAVPMDAAPMTSPSTPTMPVPTSPPPTNTSKAAFDIGPDTGYLIVDVPADAKVFVNGHATTSTGEHRQYVSHGLEAGMRYEYQVRAEIIRDGKVLAETKTVQLSAGSQADVAFDMSASPAPHTAKTGAAPRTAVLLHVPADAMVYLAGMETSSTGADREFITTKLAAGSAWDHYTVRVVSGGESREQTLTLKAGDTRELTFNFGVEKVASAAR